MRDDYFAPGALGRRPHRFGAQKGGVEPRAALEDRRLAARRPRHTIAADAGDPRRRAAQQRGESRGGGRGENGRDVVGESSAFNEFC